MSHVFVWVDIPVTDLDRAIAFYSAVIGRPVTREGGPGFVFGLMPQEGEGVSGCLFSPEGGDGPSKTGPLVYLNADGRLAEAVRAVTEHGGSVLKQVHPIGPHGFRAVVLDSEGNRLALHSPTA